MDGETTQARHVPRRKELLGAGGMKPTHCWTSSESAATKNAVRMVLLGEC